MKTKVAHLILAMLQMEIVFYLISTDLNLKTTVKYIESFFRTMFPKIDKKYYNYRTMVIYQHLKVITGIKMKGVVNRFLVMSGKNHLRYT